MEKGQTEGLLEQKQSSNIRGLELALLLDCCCWGVIHHFIVEAGLNLAMLLLVTEII